MWRHYVYVHKKADTQEIFYVGKGTEKSKVVSVPTYERSRITSKRNVWWKRTVAKHGFTPEVVASFQTDHDAQKYEKQLIATIGRAQLGNGPLVNLTDGGDGHAGIVLSAESIKKRSLAASGPRSDAWVNSIRAARRNGGNGGVVKHGDKLPESWRKNIAVTKFGRLNPMFGRCGEKHPQSRKVVNDETGEIFPSITAAAKSIGKTVQVLHGLLTGNRPNYTKMRLVENGV